MTPPLEPDTGFTAATSEAPAAVSHFVPLSRLMQDRDI